MGNLDIRVSYWCPERVFICRGVFMIAKPDMEEIFVPEGWLKEYFDTYGKLIGYYTVTLNKNPRPDETDTIKSMPFTIKIL